MSDREKTTASQEKLLGSRDWPGDALKEQPVSPPPFHKQLLNVAIRVHSV